MTYRELIARRFQIWLEEFHDPYLADMKQLCEPHKSRRWRWPSSRCGNLQ